VAVKLVPALEAWTPDGGGGEAEGGAADGGTGAATAAGGGPVSASAASILQEVQARARALPLSALSAPRR